MEAEPMILDVLPKLPDNPTRFMNQLRTLVWQKRWSNFYYTHVVRKEALEYAAR